jgi:predicted amidohydrolase
MFAQPMGGKYAFPCRTNRNSDVRQLDFEGNRDRIVESIHQAKAKNASLRTGPELEIPGPISTPPPRQCVNFNQAMAASITISRLRRSTTVDLNHVT